jgi:hypothetical protein
VRQQCGVPMGVPWLLHEQRRDGRIGRSGDRISISLGSPVLKCTVARSADGFFAGRLPSTHCKKVSDTQQSDWHARTHHIISQLLQLCVCVCACDLTNRGLKCSDSLAS